MGIKKKKIISYGEFTFPPTAFKEDVQHFLRKNILDLREERVNSFKKAIKYHHKPEQAKKEINEFYIELRAFKAEKRKEII